MATRRQRRRKTNALRGFLATVAPWAAAASLLISFTAAAGTDPTDASLASPIVERGRLGAGWEGGERTPSYRAALQRRRGVRSELGSADVSDMNTPAYGNGTHAQGYARTRDETEGADPEAESADFDDLALSDGSTPSVPRAVALSSVTPAPADATPVEVAAASLALPGFSPRRDRDPAPDLEQPSNDAALNHRFAELINPESMDREQRCLAEAVYFEARSEPADGQAAVAQVVLNRVKSGLYPASVCGVVYQNRHRYMGCQFSFACEGKALRITDAAAWRSAATIASAVIEGKTYLSEVGEATHYHADYVKPGWSRRLTKTDSIGRHIFYRLKPGQT